MTDNEAIDKIIGTMLLGETILQPDLIEAMKLSVVALQKQIPKRVIREKWTITKCPCCGGNLGDYLEDGYTEEWDHLKVCDCGQQLDWSYPEDDDND